MQKILRIIAWVVLWNVYLYIVDGLITDKKLAMSVFAAFVCVFQNLMGLT